MRREALYPFLPAVLAAVTDVATAAIVAPYLLSTDHLTCGLRIAFCPNPTKVLSAPKT
jgi:hypothetical protein